MQTVLEYSHHHEHLITHLLEQTKRTKAEQKGTNNIREGRDVVVVKLESTRDDDDEDHYQGK